MKNLPYPSITPGNPQNQVEEIKRYLYQLVDALNYQLNQLEKNQSKEG